VSSNFFRLKKPCSSCPFRNDIIPFLTQKRATEIKEALVNMDKSFSCHKTVDYSKPINENYKPSENDSQCVGALTLLIKTKTIYNNFLFRFALITKLLELKNIDLNEPIFDTWEEFIENQYF
jgi:hypothetical protein